MNKNLYARAKTLEHIFSNEHAPKYSFIVSPEQLTLAECACIAAVARNVMKTIDVDSASKTQLEAMVQEAMNFMAIPHADDFEPVQEKEDDQENDISLEISDQEDTSSEISEHEEYTSEDTSEDEKSGKRTRNSTRSIKRAKPSPDLKITLKPFIPTLREKIAYPHNVEITAFVATMFKTLFSVWQSTIHNQSLQFFPMRIAYELYNGWVMTSKRCPTMNIFSRNAPFKPVQRTFTFNDGRTMKLTGIYVAAAPRFKKFIDQVLNAVKNMP